jgi:hypothetical protein
MNINYNDGKLVSKNVNFEGVTNDGKGFTICANWNDWDDWAVDEIEWHDEEGTEEQIEEITNEFINNMN